MGERGGEYSIMLQGRYLTPAFFGLEQQASRVYNYFLKKALFKSPYL
jgi:hypothetical protein